MRATSLVLLVTLLVAGCADSAETTTSEEAGVTIDEGRPDTSFGDVKTGPAVGPDYNATTERAPELIPGEWWRIRYSNVISEGDVELVRVVAAVDETGYIMGMPHEGWLKEAISYHAPAFGDVNFDLSYNTHNMLFEPLRFPLVVGDSWETSMAATAYVATVTQASEYTATIEFETVNQDPSPADPVLVALGILPGSSWMRATYDARQHEVVKMVSPIGIWEVVEHGYDFEGWVTVPRGEDTAIDYGAFGPVSDTHTPMERTIEVADEFNRMTMMQFVGTVNDVPGHMEAREVDPDGTEHVLEFTGSGFQLAFYEVKDPGGTWTVQDTIAGAGFTYHMGIAYFQYDIRLPDGERRAAHSHAVIR